jgi:hypothetical protein
VRVSSQECRLAQTGFAVDNGDVKMPVSGVVAGFRGLQCDAFSHLPESYDNEMGLFPDFVWRRRTFECVLGEQQSGGVLENVEDVDVQEVIGFAIDTVLSKQFAKMHVYNMDMAHCWLYGRPPDPLDQTMQTHGDTDIGSIIARDRDDVRRLMGVGLLQDSMVGGVTEKDDDAKIPALSNVWVVRVFLDGDDAFPFAVELLSDPRAFPS